MVLRGKAGVVMHIPGRKAWAVRRRKDWQDRYCVVWSRKARYIVAGMERTGELRKIWEWCFKVM